MISDATKKLSAKTPNTAGAKWNDKRGAVAIEFAFCLPVLVGLFLGMVDFGGIALAKRQIGAGASAGASYATSESFDAVKISAVVAGSGPQGILASPAPFQFCGCPDPLTGVQRVAGSPPNCTTACSDGSASGTYATISAQLPFRTLVPWPGMPQSLNLDSSTTVRLK